LENLPKRKKIYAALSLHLITGYSTGTGIIPLKFYASLICEKTPRRNHISLCTLGKRKEKQNQRFLRYLPPKRDKMQEKKMWA
jgi:hypothetical protein